MMGEGGLVGSKGVAVAQGEGTMQVWVAASNQISIHCPLCLISKLGEKNKPWSLPFLRLDISSLCFSQPPLLRASPSHAPLSFFHGLHPARHRAT